MTGTQIERYMRAHGFKRVRSVRHGAFWTDGVTTLMAPRKQGDPRGTRNMLARVKRALEKRGATC